MAYYGVHGNSWKPDEDDIINKLYNDGKTDAEIGNVINRSARSSMRRRRKLGLCKRTDLNVDEIEVAKILYEDGLSVSDIGDLLGRSRTATGHVLKRGGIKLVCLHSPIIDEEKTEMIELFLKDNNYSEIAKIVGRTYQSVKKVIIEAGIDKQYRPRNIKIGDKFGFWTILSLDKRGVEPDKDGKKHHTTYWICQCVCGTIRSVSRGSLIKGVSSSCGCKQKSMVGDKSPTWKGGSFISAQGYRMIYIPDHPFFADGQYRREHSFVIYCETLHRDRHKGETIHHIDGNRLNNDKSNLKLYSSSHPSGQDVTDKLKWCVKFMNDYQNATIVSDLIPSMVDLAINILAEHQPNILTGGKETRKIVSVIPFTVRRPDEICGKGTILHFEDGFNVRDFWKDSEVNSN